MSALASGPVWRVCGPGLNPVALAQLLPCARPLWPLPVLLGVDTDELDSNVDDWEEETIEFFVTEDIIPLGSQE